MVVVPEFLIKRIYKKGSLKGLENGASFALKNVLGPGFISGVNSVTINDTVYETKDIKLVMSDRELLAQDITEANPVAFRLGQEGTLVMQGKTSVVSGNNKIVIEVLNPEAGKVQVKVEDIA